MPGDDAGWFDRVLNELKSPWDWVAAGAGATGGFIVSAMILHSDMGASVGAGALGAVTAKNAGMAAFQRRILAKRTKRFMQAIEQSLKQGGEGPSHNKLRLLVEEVQLDLDLLERKVTSPEQYGKILDDYIAAFRQVALPSPRNRSRSRKEENTTL
jgi:hypothetical protein